VCVLKTAVGILTKIAMKNVILWDMVRCSPVEVRRRFGGTYCLHRQVDLHRHVKEHLISIAAKCQLNIAHL
jgi:hypothetical protein